MVKIQTRKAKKSYLNDKSIYTYRRDTLTLMQKFHQTTKLFYHKEMDETIWVEDGCLMIRLSPKKTSKPQTLKDKARNSK